MAPVKFNPLINALRQRHNLMTQDFAKKKRASSSQKTPRKNSRRKPATKRPKAPTWAWLVIGLLLAALVTLLIYLANQPRTSEATEAVATQDTGEKKPPQPRFDFYRILKEQEVEVRDRSDEITGTLPDNLTYYLQASSLRSRDDADKLRAQLLLQNLEAFVETTTTSKGETWHRVIVGPYKSRSKAAKARSILASKKLSPLLLKRKED